jgi:hypothetical protein
MQDTKRNVMEFPLSAKKLRKSAKFICKEVKSNAHVLIYQCDDCGIPHIRFVYDDTQDVAAEGETIH